MCGDSCFALFIRVLIGCCPEQPKHHHKDAHELWEEPHTWSDGVKRHDMSLEGEHKCVVLQHHIPAPPCIIKSCFSQNHRTDVGLTTSSDIPARMTMNLHLAITAAICIFGIHDLQRSSWFFSWIVPGNYSDPLTDCIKVML
jgi:hypothetical protein